MYETSNGDVYGGYFKDNMFDGEGVYLYKSGDIYRGAFVKNMREGYGVYYYAGTKAVYEG